MTTADTYTCLACRVTFNDGDLQRQHHKSDWHWYNLKRKVVSLPPVTPEEFKAKVIEKKQKELEAEKSLQFFCSLCKKKYNSEKAFSSHKASKKHKILQAQSSETESVLSTSNSLTDKERSRRLDQEKDVISIDSEMLSDSEDVADEDWEFEGFGTNECIFCSHWSQNLDKNLKHMTSKHSFYIPDLEYLTNLDGFISYLGLKVGADYECIKCGSSCKEFRSVEAVQKHMIDKGHSIINTEGEAYLEYSDFYDFSKSYPDHNMVEDEEVPLPDDVIKVDDEMCLILPNGARVGHRSMKIYYKQNLSLDDRCKRNNTARLRLIREYKAIGWYGGEQGKMKLREEKRANMMRMKDRTRLAVKHNKFQTYFRPQVIF